MAQSFLPLTPSQPKLVKPTVSLHDSNAILREFFTLKGKSVRGENSFYFVLIDVTSNKTLQTKVCFKHSEETEEVFQKAPDINTTCLNSRILLFSSLMECKLDK